MNAMLLLAQVATNLADSVASANPVLTPVSAPAEMNMLDMAIKHIHFGSVYLRQYGVGGSQRVSHIHSPLG